MQANQGTGGYPVQSPFDSHPNVQQIPVLFGGPPPLMPPPFLPNPNPMLPAPGFPMPFPGGMMPPSIPLPFVPGVHPMQPGIPSQPHLLLPVNASAPITANSPQSAWMQVTNIPMMVPQPVVSAPSTTNSIPHLDLTVEKPPVTVFVGKLSEDVDVGYLDDVLKSVGRLSKWNRAEDPDTGKLKSFGFASYRTAEEALMAIAVLNGQKLMGQPLLVKVGKKEQAVIDDCMSAKMPNQMAVYEMRLEDARRRFKVVYNSKEGRIPELNGPPTAADGIAEKKSEPLTNHNESSYMQDLVEDPAAEAFSEAMKFRKVQEERDKKTKELRMQDLQKKLREEARRQLPQSDTDRKRENSEHKSAASPHEQSSDRRSHESSRKRKGQQEFDERQQKSSRGERMREREPAWPEEKTGSHHRGDSRSRSRRSRHNFKDHEWRPNRDEKDRDRKRKDHNSETRLLDKDDEEWKAKIRLEAAAAMENRQREEDARKAKQRMAVLAALGESLDDEGSDDDNGVAEDEEEGEIVAGTSEERPSKTVESVTKSEPEPLKLLPQPEELNRDMIRTTIGLGFNLKGSKKTPTAGKSNALWVDAEEEKVIERPVVPIDYGDDRSAAINQKDRDKQLAEMIPKDKDALFDYHVDWKIVKGHEVVKLKMRPWVVRKVKEYLGEEEPTLVDFICSKLEGRSSPKSILEELKLVLEEDAEAFTMKLWRMLIFYTLRASAPDPRGQPAPTHLAVGEDRPFM